MRFQYKTGPALPLPIHSIERSLTDNVFIQHFIIEPSSSPYLRNPVVGKRSLVGKRPVVGSPFVVEDTEPVVASPSSRSMVVVDQ